MANLSYLYIAKYHSYNTLYFPSMKQVFLIALLGVLCLNSKAQNCTYPTFGGSAPPVYDTYQWVNGLLIPICIHPNMATMGAAINDSFKAHSALPITAITDTLFGNSSNSNFDFPAGLPAGKILLSWGYVDGWSLAVTSGQFGVTPLVISQSGRDLRFNVTYDGSNGYLPMQVGDYVVIQYNYY